MARISKETLALLGGLDRNIIVDEVLYGENRVYPMQFFQTSNRVVLATSMATITFTGGDATPFQVGRMVQFGKQAQVYTVTAVGTNTITVSPQPTVTIGEGTVINTPIDMTGYTFQWRLLENTTTSVTDTNQGVVIGTVTPKADPLFNPQTFTIGGGQQNSFTTTNGIGVGVGSFVAFTVAPTKAYRVNAVSGGNVIVNGAIPPAYATGMVYKLADQINLDSSVIEINLQNGMIALQLGNMVLSDTPVIDPAAPPLYTGFVSFTQPAQGQFAAKTTKQRLAFILQSDLAVDGAGGSQ